MDKEPASTSALAAGFDNENYMADRTIKVRISSSKLDRDNDVVNQDGWDFGSYELNPVVLWNHDRSIPSPAKCEGIDKDEQGNPVARVRFAKTPFGEELLYLYKAGYLNAVSPSFTSSEFSENRAGGRNFESQKMLELSLVTIPANEDALVVQRSFAPQKDAFPKFYEHAKKLVEKMEATESASKEKENVGKPYTGPNDENLLEDISGISELNEEERAQWVEVFNETLNEEESNEEEAIRTAWSAVNSNNKGDKMESLRKMLQANSERLEAMKEKLEEDASDMPEEDSMDEDDKQLNEDAKEEIMGMLEASHNRISTIEGMMEEDLNDDMKREIMGLMEAEEEAMEMMSELLGVGLPEEEEEDMPEEDGMDEDKEDEDYKSFDLTKDDLDEGPSLIVDLDEFDFAN